MPEAEQTLAAYWTDTAAPARDLVFELGVEQAIARRRMLIDASTFAAGGVVLAAAVIVLGPALAAGAHSLVASFNPAGPVLAAAAAMAAALAWLRRVADEA